MLDGALSKLGLVGSNPSVLRYVDIDGHLRPGILLRGDRSLVAMWRVEGLSWETLEDAEIYKRRFDLNGLLVNMQSERLVLGVHEVRGSADPALYPRGVFRSTFARELDNAYREQLTGDGAALHHRR